MPRLPDPPRAKGLPVVGNALKLLRDPIGFTHRCAREIGDVVDLDIPLLPTYLVSHPDAIEQVLVTQNKSYRKDLYTRGLSALLGDGLLTSDGDHWRRQRRLAQPGFHRERVASYGDVMVAYTERAIERWSAGEVRDIHQELMGLTCEIVAKTLFDADVAREAKDVRAWLEVAVNRFNEAPPGVPLIDRVPTPGKRRFERAAASLDALIYRLIAERRAGGHDTGDLLSMLMGARDEGGGRMSDRHLRDEVMTLFLAGHETTALALTWTFLLLSRSPRVEAALHRELDEVLGGRPPCAADLPKLRYTDRVITESMRLYPPAWAIGREAIEECSIGGFRVPRGMQIWISQWIVHRDPRFFDDPDDFRPERWEGDLAKRLPRYAYFPFGGGPRLCIGSAFATMEAVLLLAAITRRFRLAVLPDQTIAMLPSVTLRPRNGLRVRIERRSGVNDVNDVSEGAGRAASVV